MVDIVRNLCEYIEETDEYLLTKVTDYLSNYNLIKCFKARWCTKAEDSFIRLSSAGTLFRLYDKIDNNLYSVYILNDSTVKHIVDTKHKHKESLVLTKFKDIKYE